jgi:hypothetical protein
VFVVRDRVRTIILVTFNLGDGPSPLANYRNGVPYGTSLVRSEVAPDPAPSATFVKEGALCRLLGPAVRRQSAGRTQGCALAGKAGPAGETDPSHCRLRAPRRVTGAGSPHRPQAKPDGEETIDVYR